MIPVFQQFCADSLRNKKLNSEFKTAADPVRQSIRACKTFLENHMIVNDLTAIRVSPGGGEGTTFLVRDNKTQARRLSAESIEQGIRDTYSSLTGGGQSPRSRAKTIWAGINNARKVDRVVFSISDKPVGGGARFVDCTNTSVKTHTLRYLQRTKTLKKIQKAKKDKAADLKQKIEHSAVPILKHLGAASKTSQKINMRHNNTPCSFYIRVKTSKTSPTVKKDMMCEIIRNSLEETAAEGTLDNMSAVLKTILDKFQSIPKCERRRVTLDKGHYYAVSDTTVERAPATTRTTPVLAEADDEEDNEDDEEEEEVIGA